jgi:DNA polymerase III subunit gamma/tau
MTTQALYNKWRGQSFADILGQEHITTTLRNQVKAGRIGHAYLFVGLRGTGKTSTARIMAKAVNCVGQTDDPPCNHCPICTSLTEGRSTDLIEIDAASNRGIDEIRDLREKVSFSPSECRYKVYVIDEVHMLTKEAFNALLKTLEEPPPHVIFILCTTEPQNLPATVLSRCQRFDFRRGSLDTISKKLQLICEHEGIHITPEALGYIARRATGSYRDAESLLDQLASFGAQEITLPQIQAVLGSAPIQLINTLVGCILGHDLAKGLRVINEALDQGADPREVIGAVLDQLRAITFILAGAEDDLALSPEDLVELRGLVRRAPTAMRTVVNAIRLFNDSVAGLKGAARPQVPLELAFIESTLPTVAMEAPEPATHEVNALSDQPSGRPLVAATSAISDFLRESGTGVAAPTPISSTTQTVSSFRIDTQPPTEYKAPAGNQPVGSVREITLEQVRQSWPQVLAKVKAQNQQVRALLSSASPVSVRNQEVVLGCGATFHRDKLMEDNKRDVVESALSSVLGYPCTVVCEIAVSSRGAFAAGTQPSGKSEHDSREEKRQQILNHPVVKELERRGGKVTEVHLNDEEDVEK